MAEAIKQFSDRVNAAFNALSTTVDNIVDDVQFLKDEIAHLQSTAGAITPEDQAILDALEARVAELSTKAAALDAATSRPPTPNP